MSARQSNPIYNNVTDARYLKIDQSNPQTVVNGTPTFNEGITATSTNNTAVTANKNIVVANTKKVVYDGE